MVPEDSNEQTEIITEITPLKALMIELHEIYECLRESGFTERTAAFIVAMQMESSLEGKFDASDMEDEDWADDEDEGTED